MDLHLFSRVLWRFRLLVGAGLVIAFALALVSTVRIGFRDGSPVVTYRDPPLWVSHSTVLLTQPGFPVGRSVLPETPTAGNQPVTPEQGPQFADLDRFLELTGVYARLAKSDEVQRLLFMGGEIPGAEAVEVVPASDTVPLLDISGIATSPEAAILLARRQTQALKAFVAAEQRANGVPPKHRVQLTVVNRAGEPPRVGDKMNTWLLQGPPKMRAAVVFLAVMVLTIALAFGLENLRPRVRAVPSEPVVDVASRTRSA